MGIVRDFLNYRRSQRSLEEDQVKFKPITPAQAINSSDNPRDDLVNQIVRDKVGQSITGDSEPSEVTSTDINQIDQMTTLAQRREQRYKIYDDMRDNDSFAAIALEMYADDITLPNPQGDSIWAESEDPNIADAANRLLKVLGIKDNLWSIAYNLVTYGDVYYKLFRIPGRAILTEDKGSGKGVTEARVVLEPTPKSYILEEYIEKVDDPSEVFDLVYRGRSIGFIRTHVNENVSDSSSQSMTRGIQNYSYDFDRDKVELSDSRSYIHIIMPDAGVRHPFTVNLREYDKSGNVKTLKYVVNTGRSLLQSSYKSSQQLQLMENSILLSRLTRSSIYRLIQVQVGQKSDSDVISLLNRIKSLLDKKQVINNTTGEFSSYNNPGPEVSNIILPVKDNGQGGVTQTTIGGDYDPKSLADLDYYINKELASYKIPRQFVNFTDGGGFNGGSSLAKISSQYAHRIARYKPPIIKGVTQLINIFFENRSPDYVNKFEIKMTNTNTIEDAERVAMTKDKLDLVEQIMSAIEGVEDTVGKFEVLKELLNDSYQSSKLNEVLQNYIDKLKSSPKTPNPPKGEGESDVGNFKTSGGSGESSFLDGTSTPEPGESNDFSDESGSSEGSTEFPTDLSGEGVDLTDTDAVDRILDGVED